MRYELTAEKWNAVKDYLNRVWRSPDKYPDRGLLLSLSDEDMTHAFTKKRLELVRLVQSKKPKNATELSRLAGRRLSAVIRDLELLEGLHMVELHKKGKNVVPTVTKEIIILPLVEFKALERARATG